MMMMIDDRSYSLRLYRVDKSNLEKAKEVVRELGGLLFGLDRDEHESVFAVAFYNACVRWHFGEAISRRFEYEFLVCLTGKTQISPLLKDVLDFETKPALYLALASSGAAYGGDFDVDLEEVELEKVKLDAHRMNVIVAVNQQLLMKTD
jgi:hypothetical protein